ncbi:MAG: hypothetical protein VW397_06040 [Candidatus Margulisiibacteriota bacterium]
MNKILFPFAVLATLSSAQLRGTTSPTPSLDDSRPVILDETTHLDEMPSTIHYSILDCLNDDTLPYCTSSDIHYRKSLISIKEQEIIKCISGIEDYNICKHPKVKTITDDFSKGGNLQDFLAKVIACNLDACSHAYCLDFEIKTLLHLGKKHLHQGKL